MIDLKQLEELAKAVIDDPIQNGTSLTPDYMRLLDEANPAVILELIETQRMLVEALKGALAVIDDYIEYEHDGDPWTEDARAMGEMDINDYSRDGRRDSAREALKRATGESS